MNRLLGWMTGTLLLLGMACVSLQKPQPLVECEDKGNCGNTPANQGGRKTATGNTGGHLAEGGGDSMGSLSMGGTIALVTGNEDGGAGLPNDAASTTLDGAGPSDTRGSGGSGGAVPPDGHSSQPDLPMTVRDSLGEGITVIVGQQGGAIASGGGTTSGTVPLLGGMTAKGGAGVDAGVATGGVLATGGVPAAGGAVSSVCISPVTTNRNPFACKFGWGSSIPANAPYEQFITQWVGYEKNGGLDTWSGTGTNLQCDGCALMSALGPTATLPAFYTYWIGYQARESGFGDCDLDIADGHNLCTDGAAWILGNWATIVRAYAEYARKVESVYPGKASLWLLESNLSQYANSGRQVPRPLSWIELGKLVSDITCAIKANHPKALVYVNYSFWLTTDVATSFFSGMPLTLLDGVWMSGEAGLAGKLTADTYTTVTYAWLHQLTGLPLYVASRGSGQSNWVNASPTDLSARIADGVVAAHIDPQPTNAQALIAGFQSTLPSTCP